MATVIMRITGTSYRASASFHKRYVGPAKARNDGLVAMQLVAGVPNARPVELANSRYATRTTDADQRFDASLMNLFMRLKAVDPSRDPTVAAQGGNEIRQAYEGLPATSAAPAVLTSRRVWPYRP